MSYFKIPLFVVEKLEKRIGAALRVFTYLPFDIAQYYPFLLFRILIFFSFRFYYFINELINCSCLVVTTTGAPRTRLIGPPGETFFHNVTCYIPLGRRYVTSVYKSSAAASSEHEEFGKTVIFHSINNLQY